MEYAKGRREYQNFLLENKIDGLSGTDFTDLYIQELSQCIGGKVYRDMVTGQAFTPANLADGVVRNGTWATANSDWKLASIKNMYDIFNSVVFNSTGYQKLPSGLILQWGINSFVGTSVTTITTPIQFPNSFFFVGGFNASSYDGGLINNVKIIALNSFQAEKTTTGTTGYRWFAIGC